MRSLFQKRNFGKVFGLVKRTDDLANQNRVKILKVPTGANSSIVMQSKILEFKSSLAEEHDIRNKIKLINLLTIQLRVLDSDKLGGDVINILDQHEDEVFTFLQQDTVSIDDQMLVILSLYFDPRFISRKLNGSRLTNLLTDRLAKIVAQKQESALGLTEERNTPKNLSRRPLTDSLLKRLLDTELPQNQKLAHQIAEHHLTGMHLLSSDELLTRVERVLSYLIFEHKNLQSRFRYTSDKVQIEQNSLLVRVIDEIEQRIEQGRITRECFLKMLFMGSEGHRREVLYFRLFRHFSPAVIKFVTQNFIAKDSSPMDLWRITYSYAMDNHEQDMRIVYSDFLHSILDRIADDDVLLNPTVINRESLRNVVRSLGSLLTLSDSVIRILQHFNKTLLDEIKFNKNSRLIDDISIFIQTSVNLKCYQAFAYESEIAPLLDFVAKQNVKNDPKSVLHYLSILKGLAKGVIYHHQNRPIEIWNQFLEGDILPIIQGDLKCLGQYAYVAQVVSTDLETKIEMPDLMQITMLRKLKSGNHDNNYNLHNQVKRMLTNAGIEYQQELPVGVLSVDFYLPKYRIAIELDGPSHFIIKKDRSLTLSGTSLAKQRVMAKCGQFDRIFQAVGNLAQAEVKSVEDVMEEIQDLISM